jgi:hypothetical protein
MQKGGKHISNAPTLLQMCDSFSPFYSFTDGKLNSLEHAEPDDSWLLAAEKDC